MIKFISYNRALMWSRLEQIVLVCGAAAIVAMVEISFMPPMLLEDILANKPLPENTPYPIFSMITSFAAQIWCLKCWMDMLLKGRPGKNCWEFKE